MNLLIRTGAFLALLTACGSETPSTCAAGRVKPCPCASGQGAQTCQRDGTFGACVCPDAGAGMDATLDASDAPACDADLQNDPGNCGECGRRCEGGPDAGSVCRAGRCALVCDPAHADCDGNPANGCETALNTMLNCAGCGMACAAPNATTECRAGTCVLRACSTGFFDCDRNAANGCEIDGRSDSQNCGGCASNSPALPERVCRPGAPCRDSACRAIDCTDGGACPTNSMCCPAPPGAGPGNRCLDLMTDVMNCGACGNACPLLGGSYPSCVAGVCSFTCRREYVDCDGNPANGCEVGILSNERCGACNGPPCDGGTCTFAECDGGMCIRCNP